MPKKPLVFISYRRSDSSATAGRIYDRLVQALGKSNVFKDSYNIAQGADFREVITNNVSHCNVVLVIIGPSWLTTTAKDNPTLRRLDEPNDWVRFEVETGLQTPGTNVIPVLVQNASMPHTDELPEGLGELAYKNATVVRDDPDFDTDVARLIQGIVPPRRSTSRIILSVLSVVALLVVALFAYVLSHSSIDPSPPNPTNSSITDTPKSNSQLDLSRTPNALTGLLIGGQARVHLSNGFGYLDVRRSPTNQSPLLEKLLEGDIVTLLDGPVQAPEKNDWVKLRTLKGIEGWASVLLTDTQALIAISSTEIVNSPTDTVPPTATINVDLSRTPNSFSGLVIGGLARVHLSNGYPAFDIRSAPDYYSLLRVTLGEGAIVTILDGPVLGADKRNWWKIRTSTQVEGWSPELLSNTQALMPITVTATPKP